MEERIKQFDAIITLLETIEVDGEMMEYIIDKCGLKEQMTRQLWNDSSKECQDILLKMI